MKNIIESKMVAEMNPDYMAEKINKEIKEGWQPFGQMFLYTPKNNVPLWYQMVVKYEK